MDGCFEACLHSVCSQGWFWGGLKEEVCDGVGRDNSPSARASATDKRRSAICSSTDGQLPFKLLSVSVTSSAAEELRLESHGVQSCTPNGGADTRESKKKHSRPPEASHGGSEARGKRLEARGHR